MKAFVGGVACGCHRIRSAGKERETTLDRMEIFLVRRAYRKELFSIEFKEILELSGVIELTNSLPFSLSSR